MQRSSAGRPQIMLATAASADMKKEVRSTPTTPVTLKPTTSIMVTPSSSGGQGKPHTFTIVKQDIGSSGRQRTASSSSSDHEYGQVASSSSSFSTPRTVSLAAAGASSASSGPRRTIYLTPSSSSGGTRARQVVGMVATSGGSGSSVIMVGHQGQHGGGKTEARRKLNLDTGPVDPEGFKTPIKATKRRVQDLSSPSPKKSEC